MQTGFLKEHSALLAFSMRAIDLLILAASGILSFNLIDIQDPQYNHYLIALLTAALLSSLLNPFFGVYRSWRGMPLRDELRAMLIAWSGLFACLTVLAVMTKTGHNYSRLWLGCWYVGGYGSLVLARICLRGFLSHIRTLGHNQRQIVIAGAGSLGQQVAQRIRATPWTGLELLGFFAIEENRVLPDDLSDLPILGSIDNLAAYIETNPVDQIWIAISLDKAPQIKKLINELALSHCDIRYVPDIFSFQLLNHSVTEIAGLPVMNISVSPMEGLNRIVKAIEDRGLALMILLMVSPLMLALMIGVKLSSRGPIFYHQERVSWNGRPFKMIKFRSMPVETESSGVSWGGADQKNLNGFGRFIRRTSLDELPQFINVLLGDMSVVGPRPERPHFVEQFKHDIPRYMQKHKVKAGITGWAQINGWRGDTDLKRRIEHDLFYIENWSLGLDLKIIFMTLFKGFVHKNAR
ncbi:undecaprenyl-phosphate glucose phosphotransferase [Motiliproteus sp. MSK22-1]|uniref:undecaprenyl-phosphate glucose phosphotransferase n=1 Tax=Motiliproteus sp. MSK22-1 TaxID=1897630 RepID=UPI000977A3DC|nr:undecaprenyl-phosphate glucose phosphotransferase [Motiliproteus sp. MSK22-1]OMH30402.1 undecaprenyl-phosphate glucose phosphotransferase [Motiliproteus sp. MSK22-1]